MNMEQITNNKTIVKKIAIIALALMMTFAFIGCGKKKDSQDDTHSNTDSSVSDTSNTGFFRK